jgi:hypothetical protein
MNDDAPQWLRQAFEEQARLTTEMSTQHAQQIQELATQSAATMARLASRIDVLRAEALGWLRLRA